ncbi:MAG: leucyl aminopeptidase, partial [Amylibacter sp.]|nr:leucyl aminopeptidase [Amylibacter sp.]
MTSPISPSFIETDLDLIDAFEGKIVCFMTPAGGLDPLSRRVNKLAKGALARFSESTAFEEMKVGGVQTMDFPASIKAKSIVVIKLGKKADADVARNAGAAAMKSVGKSDAMLLAGASRSTADVAQGMVLRAYDFNDHKSGEKTDQGTLTVVCTGATETETVFVANQAQNEGVFFTRDLVNEPANVLTTETFADRLIELEKLGMKVKVLEEADMGKLGMGSLLSVGLGSPSPSKLVVMEWNGGGGEKPFAFVGKGVVFDTGGISIKPAAGMEDMT